MFPCKLAGGLVRGRRPLTRMASTKFIGEFAVSHQDIYFAGQAFRGHNILSCKTRRACRTHSIPQISGGQQVKENCEVQKQDHNNGHMTGTTTNQLTLSAPSWSVASAVDTKAPIDPCICS